MTLITTIRCTKCNKDKTITHSPGSSPPIVCHECIKSKEERVKKAHLVELSALSTEERLAKIEEQLYDHKQVPHGYQKPPRF